MQHEATTSHRPCLERAADGWRWRAITSTGLSIMQAAVTVFLGVMGVLLLALGVRIAVEPDQVGQSMLLLLDASGLVVIVIALRSMIVRLVPWPEAVFIVEGARPQVLLLRGGRRKVIALADVAAVRVVHEGPVDREPTDTYLEVRRAGRRLALLVGRRGYEPTAASELRELLPADIEVRTRNTQSRAWSATRAAVCGAAISLLFLAAVAPTLAKTPSSKAGTAAPAHGAVVSSISGAGTPFPYPLYLQWAGVYQKEAGVGLNYQSIGSGAGVKQVLAKTVTFAASDMPLSGAELDKENLAQFPAVLGGVVAVVNLDGVAPGELTLDGPTVARIFLGEIKKWDDPAIAGLNPSLKLPSADIVTIHRGDGSGTTLFWTDYLSKVSPDWKSRVGSGTSVEWPVGHSAKGSEGVSGPLLQTKGAITYMDYAYARLNKLVYVKLVNRHGETVAPDREAIQAAAANADWASAPGFGLLLTDQPGAGSWPIVHTTFVVMRKKVPNAGEAAAALAFFNWGYDKGGPLAERLDYVPLPPGVVNMVKRSWTEITAGGKPVFSGH